LDVKKDMFGINIETVTSALRLATISAISGKFAESAEVFAWIFEVGADGLDLSGTSGFLPGKLAAGLAAAGMAFLDRNDPKGNRLLRRASDLTKGDLRHNVSTKIEEGPNGRRITARSSNIYARPVASICSYNG
jgi:hypothetical protein